MDLLLILQLVAGLRPHLVLGFELVADLGQQLVLDLQLVTGPGEELVLGFELVARPGQQLVLALDLCPNLRLRLHHLGVLSHGAAPGPASAASAARSTRTTALACSHGNGAECEADCYRQGCWNKCLFRTIPHS